MGGLSMLRKVRAYGVAYSLEYKLGRPLSARLRGRLAAARLTRVGSRFLVEGPLAIELDGGSEIRFGNDCCLQDGVVLRSIRRDERTPGARIEVGDNCVLKRGALLLAKSGRIRIGPRSAVGRLTEISCEDAEVSIGCGVRIAAGCWIGTGNHVFDAADRPIVEQGTRQLPVTIEDDVWLGTQVIIVPGVTVGRGSVIAAGAVVTRDVPAGSIVGGVPGRVLKPR